MRMTVTRRELAKIVAERCCASRPDTATILEHILEEIATALIDGQHVKLSGFGKFETRHRAPRLGRNVNAGHFVQIGPRRVVVFDPSPRMIAAISPPAHEGAERGVSSLK